MIGRVISTKMQKSAVVLVNNKKKHPLYKKTFLRTKKYLVDDPIGVKDGNIVEIIKIKPVSRHKHWGVVKVLGTDIVTLGTEVLKEEAKEAIEEVLPVEKQGEAAAQEPLPKEEVKKKVGKTEKVKIERPKRKRKGELS
ncbi:mitochondrial small ribosomal subunit protein uS17m [Candidatus Daviesbacteria bacterium]|nr:mitochondrial small ribosomal subunit protein uS17m [Candidatus Daviesbacteria bacterium]